VTPAIEWKDAFMDQGDGPNLIAISVGNTRTQIGSFVAGKLQDSARFANDDLARVLEHVVSAWRHISELDRSAILLASVNDPVAHRLTSMIEGQLSTEIYRVGEDVPVPIGQQLDPETITGVDRLLNAAAAYERLHEACIVVDAGTAVTIDFVDGEGTFHGGAIAPGARMQLHAMHEHTSALPDLEFAAPDADAFGRNTRQAMLHGVFHGIRGMVWKLTELYAEHYGAYPKVIATGGDAQVLFERDELIDNIVPDLTLHGIAAAARSALARERESD
jgi:type III pantothenate kinase